MHRIHSWAKVHASDRTIASRESPTPTAPAAAQTSTKPQDGNRRPPPRSTASAKQLAYNVPEHPKHVPNATANDVADNTSAALPPPAPPPQDTAVHDEKRPTLAEAGDGSPGPAGKPGLSTRMTKGSKRFVKHTKEAIFHSWINVLLVFVPIGIAVNWAPINDYTKSTVVFALNAVAIIPLAGLLSHATESVASRMGDTWASLLNVTFGNAVELIIFIIALAKNEIRIVQASILGSILANLLLILGMSFLLGGLRFQEQIYNCTVTQMSACLLSLSVMSLLLPTAFHASFASNADADTKTTKISRGTSVVLLLVYVLYLLFQLKSHAYMYESTPQNVIDEESHPGVLADIMNYSSSSDDSSSSDSGDSDTSSDSQNTAAKRFKRALRHRKRRKSNASSFRTPSVPSILSSPSLEKPSFLDEQTTSPTEGYFDLTERQKLAASILDSNGEETEKDTKVERGQPLVRDFETGHAGSSESASKSPESEKPKSRKRRHKKSKKEKKESHVQQKQNETTEATKSVGFVEEIAPANGTANIGETTNANSPLKRPFALRQFSKPSFRPAIPSLLAKNVFVAPQNPPSGTPGEVVPLSIARIPGPSLRRTSSLPDRLNRQAQAGRTNAAAPHASNSEPAPRGAAPTVKEPDALEEAVDDEDEAPAMSRTAAVMLLIISTGLVAFCAELLVDSIPHMIQNTSVSQAFIGLIILPIVGNAAEHVTAVTVAMKNKMDLCIGVAVGSSIQIALFVTPFVVLLGWLMDKPMSLYFNLFETVSLFVTAFVVNFLVLDGRSNYLEGSLLIAAYVIIAVAAFFYPNTQEQSPLGGGQG